MLQKPYLCNVFPTRRQASGVATKGHGRQKCRCGSVHTTCSGKIQCDAIHTFFYIIHIKPRGGAIRHNLSIMEKYKFIYSSGDVCNYTCAKDSEALEAAKEYIITMKKLNPHISYVMVAKVIGKGRYSMVGKHEI